MNQKLELLWDREIFEKQNKLEEQKNQQNRELKIVKQPDSSASDADMMEDDLIFIDLDADAVKKKRTSIKHKADTERVHKKRRKRKRKK